VIDLSKDRLSLLFQVPFIAFYRKEHIEPDLEINDLWKIWQWDEKVKLHIQNNCSKMFEMS
jgi:transcription elongation factor SPT6